MRQNEHFGSDMGRREVLVFNPHRIPVQYQGPQTLTKCQDNTLGFGPCSGPMTASASEDVPSRDEVSSSTAVATE